MVSEAQAVFNQDGIFIDEKSESRIHAYLEGSGS